jgi:DNA-binding GntR family transcriptional regulator
MRHERELRDPSSSLAQLRPRSLRSDAAGMIRAAIVSGELSEGSRVNESRLSVQLGISRGPIREALRELEREGRLVSRPNYGAYVASFTLEDVVESTTVRELLEPYVTERSLERAHEELLEGLRQALRDMGVAAKERDKEALVNSHDDFHAQFYLHAHHRLILSIWQRIRVPLQSHMRLQEIGYRQLEDIPRAHQQLFELARANNAKALRAEVLSHLRMNLARFAEAMDSNAAQPHTQPLPRRRARKVS